MVAMLQTILSYILLRYIPYFDFTDFFDLLQFSPEAFIGKKSALVQKMAWRLTS